MLGRTAVSKMLAKASEMLSLVKASEMLPPWKAGQTGVDGRYSILGPNPYLGLTLT